MATHGPSRARMAAMINWFYSPIGNTPRVPPCPPNVALKGLQIATRIWFDSCHAIIGVEISWWGVCDNSTRVSTPMLGILKLTGHPLISSMYKIRRLVATYLLTTLHAMWHPQPPPHKHILWLCGGPYRWLAYSYIIYIFIHSEVPSSSDSNKNM